MTATISDLSRLTLGTAPDSWGVWFARDEHQVGWKQYLDEVQMAGYVWTELGRRVSFRRTHSSCATNWISAV